MIIKRTIKQKGTNEDFGLTFTDNFLTNTESNISYGAKQIANIFF